MAFRAYRNALRRRRQVAFTLLEMMIVVAILVILVALTLPRVKYALDESKIRESTRQLNSYISMAKARAAATGRPCGIFLQSEDITGGATTPGTFQCTQLYLAEIPPAYSGDTLEAKFYMTPDAPGRWLATPNPPASDASLRVLVQPNQTFMIRFDHKGTLFPAEMDAAFNVYVYASNGIAPPMSNGTAMTNPYAGYAYEIYRQPERIGSPLALPLGTSIDFSYCGFGNSGTNFYSASSFVLVMFSPNGRVNNVTYQTWDSTNSVYQAISDDAPGAIHFLVGRPEKVGRAGSEILQSNLADSSALWVSIGRLTGSVVTTDNAPDITMPLYSPPTTPAEQQANAVFLTTAREFAITQDSKGGQ